MFRLILWGLIIYLVVSVFKIVRRITSSVSEREKNISHQQNTDARKSYSIDQKDIVDAKFEEIKEDKDKKTGE